MGRAPCCEEKGLKKGPWIPEEDQILISYIQRHGHGNWRALPKQAGLLRCGKSCRLRWTNYLRPDIKRGNFTAQEEETIIKLHQMLGNRWSAIAAKLPGRTDNEIKNHWRTHLKKRVFNETMTINADATDVNQDETNKHRRQCSEQQCESTAIPRKESESKSESKSESNASTGSESCEDKGNAIDHKDSDLTNEDFWADVLSETSFSIENEGGFEAQSSTTLLAAPTIFDVSQAWGLEEDDGLSDYIWGRHI